MKTVSSPLFFEAFPFVSLTACNTHVKLRKFWSHSSTLLHFLLEQHSGWRGTRREVGGTR